MSRASVISIVMLAAVTVASGCMSKSDSDPPRPRDMDGGGREPSEDAGPMADASEDDAGDVVAPGGRVLFTITVGNVSGRAIDGATVLLRVPTGMQFHHTSDVAPDVEHCGNVSCTAGEEATWTLGTLASGASRVVTVNAVVLDSATDGSSISTPVRFTAPGLNPKQVETTVNVRAAAPPLVLASGGDYLAAGERVSLELDVGNGSAFSLTSALRPSTSAR